MELNIEEMNKSSDIYTIPSDFLVLNLFQHSPLDKHFFILGQNLKEKDVYGIFYFDGISEFPTSYETFYKKT